MNFCSDNVSEICPEIMSALIAANHNTAMPYGDDEFTQTLQAKFSTLFEKQVIVFPVVSGSSANALALSVLTPPFGSIYCHQDAHIYLDECGAAEFYTGGAKLIPLAGENGKITASELAIALEKAGAGIVHHNQPASISITQATEAGTTYKISEIKAICEVAKKHNLKVHIDGARFANAIVNLGCTPAEMTWKIGVDVLSFGATKNGAMAAEAVIFFDQKLAETFIYRRKRAGHLLSKMRFLSVQLEAYIQDKLWLKNADHANKMASKLAQGLETIPGVKIYYPVEVNEIFVQIPAIAIAGLLTEGFKFYRWPVAHNMLRLVTAFNTKEEDVLKFIQVVKQYLKVDQEAEKNITFRRKRKRNQSSVISDQ